MTDIDIMEYLDRLTTGARRIFARHQGVSVHDVAMHMKSSMSKRHSPYSVEPYDPETLLAFVVAELAYKMI